MRIELDISERLVRKIRALNMLLGGQSTNFEELLSALLERSVSEAIAGELGLFDAPEQAAPLEAPPSLREDDVTGISDGLGDEEEEEDPAPPAPVRSMTDVIPRRGGLTDKVLDDDMTISDPEHEAKADAASFVEEFFSDTAENLFADLAGLPAPETKRRRQLKLRGRVTPFNGLEESQI